MARRLRHKSAGVRSSAPKPHRKTSPTPAGAQALEAVFGAVLPPGKQPADASQRDGGRSCCPTMLPPACGRSASTSRRVWSRRLRAGAIGSTS